jgi:hypothetical protein
MNFISIIKEIQEISELQLVHNDVFYSTKIDLSKGSKCVETETGYTSVGRFYKKHNPNVDSVTLSKFSELFNSMILNSKAKVEFSDTPSEIYDKNHSGFWSCMAGRGEELFEKFDKHKDCSIAYIKDEHGSIVARCLIWKGEVYDNIYARSGFHTKIEMELTKKGMKGAWQVPVCIPFDYYEGEPIPYMDNVKNYCSRREMLFNEKYVESQENTEWENDWGTDHLSFEFFEGIYSDLTGGTIPDANAVWSSSQESYLDIEDYNVVCTYDEDYIHLDYVHDYIDVDGEYHLEDECVEVDGKYVLEEDCVELDNGYYCLKEDAVICSIDEGVYHIDDCVQLENGEFVNKENKNNEELQAENQLIEA